MCVFMCVAPVDFKVKRIFNLVTAERSLLMAEWKSVALSSSLESITAQ